MSCPRVMPPGSCPCHTVAGPSSPRASSSWADFYWVELSTGPSFPDTAASVRSGNQRLAPKYAHSGLAGPWNRGIIAHQTPHFRRPPKHVNNKGPSVFAQTFCTAWFISLENLHIYSKTYVFSNTFEGFRPKCTFRGCLSKYRRTFIVYMFRRPPEVWSLMSDNALISGTGKVGISRSLMCLQ